MTKEQRHNATALSGFFLLLVIFGTLNKDRVELTTGRDLELKNYNKHVNFFIYPLVEGTSFTKAFNYKNI